jgi:hypothetical protein
METMERRSFIKLTLGLAAVAAGTAAVTPSRAMPVMAPVEPPQPKAEAKPEPAVGTKPDTEAKPESAVATQSDIDTVKPENVQYWRRRWRYRRWRWRRRWRRY